jgi:hypothetical protein
VADFSNSTLPDPLSASTRIDARRPSGFNALRTGRHGKTVKHAPQLTSARNDSMIVCKIEGLPASWWTDHDTAPRRGLEKQLPKNCCKLLKWKPPEGDGLKT